MARERFDAPINPYHYVLHCLGGKWKMAILHEICTCGAIHFNRTLKALPISEKVLSQQLKELVSDGLVQRTVNGEAYPPSIEYSLTANGEKLLPALDILYIWAIRRMDEQGIPIDADSFSVHRAERYVQELKDIMEANGFRPDEDRA